MQIIGVGQLRSDTLGYLDRVAGGEILGVIRRGKLVAWICDQDGLAEVMPQRRSLARNGEQPMMLHLNALRNSPGQCFDRVAAGALVEVTHQGQTVAHIVAAHAQQRLARRKTISLPRHSQAKHRMHDTMWCSADDVSPVASPHVA